MMTNELTRSKALGLKKGDQIQVGNKLYVVITKPKQQGGRPLMIAVRDAQNSSANARLFQLGHHKMTLVNSAPVS